jgi:6-phosphogluconolactonase
MDRSRTTLVLAFTMLAACSSCGSRSGIASSVSPSAHDAASESAAFVYVGGGDGRITRFALNEQSGALSAMTPFDAGPNPSFLAVASDGRTLFAVNEGKPGQVSSFAIQPGSGDLTLLSRTPSGGDGPTHLSIDRTGRWLLVANYDGGTSAVIPIRADGSLGAAASTVSSGRMTHFITTSPDNRFVFVPCIGPNHIAQYRFDAATGTLTPNSPAALVVSGANPGPRHLAFHPSGELAFLMNEHSSAITALRYDRVTGLLSEIQTVSALPAAIRGNTGAEVQVHPSGKYLYSSNRGHNSIAVFSVDQTSGRLELLGTAPTGGLTPRHFSLNANGTMLFAANQQSGNVVAMRVNADGSLGPLGEVATGLVSPQFVAVVRVPLR